MPLLNELYGRQKSMMKALLKDGELPNLFWLQADLAQSSRGADNVHGLGDDGDDYATTQEAVGEARRAR